MIGVTVLGVIDGIRSFVPMIRHHNEDGGAVNAASISGFFHTSRPQPGCLLNGGPERCHAPALPPEWVGLRVLRAIRDREFYILTHAGEHADIQARHDRIQASSVPKHGRKRDDRTRPTR
jgi:hypothetical protein